MSQVDLSETEMQILGVAIRRQILRIDNDIRSLTKRYGADVRPDIIPQKRRNILTLRGVAKKLRFELDV